VVAGCICALLLVHNLGVLRAAAASESEREVRSRAEVLAAAKLLRSADDVLLAPLPEPGTAPDLDIEALRSMAEHGKLPALPADRDVLAELTMATTLEVALADHPLTDGAAPTVLQALQDVTVGAAGRSGCQTVVATGAAPTVSLRSEGPTVLALATSAAGKLAVVLQEGGRSGPRRELDLPVGPSFLNLGGALSVDLGLPPGSSVELCGASLRTG
jgi:hypothetical protein